MNRLVGRKRENEAVDESVRRRREMYQRDEYRQQNRRREAYQRDEHRRRDAYQQDEYRQQDRRREELQRNEEFQRRKKKLLRRRKRRSRWRRLRKRLFRLLLAAAIGAGLVFAGLRLSSLSIFRKKIDVSKLEIPQWIEEDYIEPNPYSRPQTELEWVNGVVVHYVGNPDTTAKQNQSYFNGLAESHKTYASSHFIIGLDGEIIQCIPLDEIAYCSNDRNQDTISIECCHPDESGEFTQATYDSLVRLTRWLCESFKLDSSEDVIRHYDVTGKECPLYYVRNQEAWEQFIRDLR